jgi:hypothetical protein
MSAYRSSPCPDCSGTGRIERCEACGGAGTLTCDICNGTAVRQVPKEKGGPLVPCLCEHGYYQCAACGGGTGRCGRCGGSGMLEG